jgi:hypothetical protein
MKGLDHFLKLSPAAQKQLEEQFRADPDFFYQSLERERLREAKNKSARERFLEMTRLMKLNRLLQSARRKD